jgi:GWxTD domain-containing protein
MRFNNMQGRDRLFIEALSFPSDDKNKSQIVISLQIPYEMLVFTKSPDRTSKDYISSFDISIEIFDKDKNFIDRKIKQEIIELDELERKSLIDKFYNFKFIFEVAPNRYNILVEVNDRESSNGSRREIKLFEAKDYSKKKISDIALYPPDITNADSAVFFPSIVPFGENSILYAEIINYNEESDKIYLKIDQLMEKQQKDSIYNIQIPPNFITKKQYAHDSSSNTEPIYQIKFPLKTDTFQIMKYEITLNCNSNLETSVKKMFDILWQKMPLSLRDFVRSQSYLKLITTKAEFDSLKAGSIATQREKFLEFWKKRNPTPNTAYNKLMAEFYTRVDYAILNFSSIAKPDGSDTDRGKTYILYGKPDDIIRRLDPKEAPREIWIYNKLNKKFTFVDESRQGNYTLLSTESL